MTRPLFFFLCSSSDVAEELRLPAAARCPHVRPAAGEGHALGRGRHAAFLRHPGDGDSGRDDDRVSRRDIQEQVATATQFSVFSDGILVITWCWSVRVPPPCRGDLTGRTWFCPV